MLLQYQALQLQVQSPKPTCDQYGIHTARQEGGYVQVLWPVGIDASANGIAHAPVGGLTQGRQAVLLDVVILLRSPQDVNEGGGGAVSALVLHAVQLAPRPQACMSPHLH